MADASLIGLTTIPTMRPTISVPTAVIKAKENVKPPFELVDVVAFEAAPVVKVLTTVWVTVEEAVTVTVVDG